MSLSRRQIDVRKIQRACEHSYSDIGDFPAFHLISIEKDWFPKINFKWLCLKRCLSEDRPEVNDVGPTNLPLGLHHRQERHLKQLIQHGRHQPEQTRLVELLQGAGEDFWAQHPVIERPVCVRTGDGRGDPQPVGGVQGQQEASGGADEGQSYREVSMLNCSTVSKYCL